MRSVLPQPSFRSGQIDPLLAASSDLSVYENGAQILENMVILPGGGVQTRPGTVYLDHLSEASNGVKLAAFSFGTDDCYLIAFCDQSLVIYHDGERVSHLSTPYQASDLGQLNYSCSGKTLIVVHPDHAPRRLICQEPDSSWLFEPLNLAHIPQYDFSAYSADGAGAKENVWSDRRGWPTSVYIFESRLFFGGSASRPRTIWGSRKGDFFDFGMEDETNPHDHDAVEATLDHDQVGSIQHISSLKDLIILTDGGIFVHSSGPVTPGNFILHRQTRLPASRLRSVAGDGSLVFVRDGSDGSFMGLYAMRLDNQAGGYSCDELSFLAGTIIDKPSAIAARSGSKSNNVPQIFLLNNDGTVAVFHTLRRQQLAGWTLLTFQGAAVVDIQTIGPALFLVMKRTINGADVYYLEKLDEEARLDCSITREVTSETRDWAGFDPLDGEAVTLILDEAPLGQTDVSDGAITTDHAGVKLQAGFDFGWTIETLPVGTRLNAGPPYNTSNNRALTGGRHRPVKAVIALYESGPIKVNGVQEVFGKFSSRSSGRSFNEAPEPFSGNHTVRMQGYYGKGEEGARVKIQGTGSLPSTVLGLTLEVSI